MTIVAETTISPRLWRGYADPGLPIGAYIGSQTVTGDASGGSELVDFVFALEGAPVSGRYYNIEQITAHTSDAVSVGGSIVATNWETVGPTGLADRVWACNYVTDGLSDAGLSFERLPELPIFLGLAQPVPDLATIVRFRLINTLNRVLFAQIQGYIWEPRSSLVDGGLRRPIEALYG